MQKEHDVTFKDIVLDRRQTDIRSVQKLHLSLYHYTSALYQHNILSQ